MRFAKRTLWGVFSVATLLSILATHAVAASPSLSIITPRGGQRGTEVAFTFSGGNLGDAQEILFYEPGFEVTKIEPNGNVCVATVKIAPDCRLGEHVAQVRTASGISDYRTLYVGGLQTVAEVEPNTTFDQPQVITLNVTVDGIVQSEDVDYFVVEAKKGQRIAAEVEGMRLGVTMFDPYVAILDAKRFELSAADDTPLVKQDAVAAVVAPEDGKYFIEVRESAYGGNGSCIYRLHVGTFPRPTAIYPAGGKIGEETEFRFLGDPTGEIVKKFTLPAAVVENYGVFAEDENGIAPSENPVRLFAHGNALEQEPNNTFAEATSAALPLAFNGIIEKPEDVDHFKFTAKKGEVYEVECYARRIRSGLDSVMGVYYADGRGIAGNDDSRGPDSYLRFTAPEDAEYAVQVTDHLKRGGVDFVYRIEFTPIVASLQVGIPRVARYSQYRQTIYVPRGNKFASLFSISRSNFGGDVVLDPQALPQGVTMVADPMPAAMSEMPVLFEAAADAPIDGQLVDFRAKITDPNQNISGAFYNRADFVIAEPGQSLYSWRDVTQLAVAVVDELPFKLEIVEPKVPLVRNGQMYLKIVATRKEGFNEAINVQFPFRPPGVGAASSVDIPAGQNEVQYFVNANSGATLGKWKVFALGSANVNGTAWVSTQLCPIEIAEPYLQLAMDRAAVEQGKETEVVCKVQKAREFEGVAKVTLVGLPNAVTAPVMDLNKDMPELIFKVKTDAASPVGNHKNLFCQVVITENNEPVVHNVGSTEIRIDAPLPAPTTPAPVAEAPKTAEPAPPMEKRLTRLEQLRLDAKKKADAAGAGGTN